MVICEYCSRDKRETDPGAKDVWVPIRKGESTVLRRLPTPREKKNAPRGTIPLFDPNKLGYQPGYTDPFDNDKKQESSSSDLPF